MDQLHGTLHPNGYAYVDRTGSLIIDASKYEGARSFSDGLAAVWLINKGWGFIDKTGRVVIDSKFDQVLSFSNGLAAVQIGGRWGFINKSGEVVIDPQYEWVNSFSEGIAVVVKAVPLPTSSLPRTGPTSRVEVTKRQVESQVESSPGGLVQQAPDKDVLIIDTAGRIILAPNMKELHLNIYEHARFSDGLIDAYDCKKKKTGFVDKTGRFVIEPTYDEAAPFSEGLARVSITDPETDEEKLGFIDRSGRFVIPLKFNTDGDFRNSTDFSQGLAGLTENLQPTVTEKGKFAYIDKSGALVLLTGFFSGRPFRQGFAAVYDAETDKWGFIDRTGKVAIPVQYDVVEDFSEGLAVVMIAR